MSEVPKTAAAPPDPYALTLPTTLTTQPLGTTTFAIPGAVRYGEERCFVVRAVDVVTGTITVGRASQPAVRDARGHLPAGGADSNWPRSPAWA